MDVCGCFETLASMKRFREKAIKELNLKSTTKPEEFQSYIRKNINNKNSKNNKVLKVVDEYLENVSIGIANIINMYEPETIAFGGSFSYYSDIFLEPLYEKTMKKVLNKDTKVRFVKAILENNAGIIGSVIME